MPYTVSHSDGYVSQQLALDEGFRTRVRAQLVKWSATVLNEAGVGADHGARANYAKLVLGSPTAYAALAADYLSLSTNVVAGTITLDDAGPRTGATDADIYSQINSDWNKLALVDKGN